ncbi:MAG: hypothetical protein WBB34_02805 [Xanthobacteraceae bacterium]
MTKAAKAGEERRVTLPQTAGDDVLNFLSRTLQAHNLDGESLGALEKLQTLMVALEKQEITLSNWPDSPSKARMCNALAKARGTVSRVAADLARQRPEGAGRDIRSVKAI